MGDTMAPKARASYLERAGAEGTKVLAVYDEERKKLGFWIPEGSVSEISP